MLQTLDDFGGLLDLPRLQAWIEANDIPGAGPITGIQRLAGGSQNNVFLMKRGRESFVLRRPPEHLRKNSNATMLREARVLKALAGSEVPHAAFHGVCADETVIGACFYIMAPLEGTAFVRGSTLSGGYARHASWRRAMGEELVTAAAALSRVDYKAVGLADFGKPDNWHARQVARWRSQLDSYSELEGYPGASLPHVDEVADWLGRNTPTSGRIGIIHGDYHFPNVMFAPDRPKIAGLIDWELSALGDPILDLTWVLTSWWEEDDAGGKPPNLTPWDGFMSRAELIRLYGDLTGRDMSDISWYFALACFKLGCILEGTYARAMAGQATMEMGRRLHLYSVWLLNKARQIVASA